MLLCPRLIGPEKGHHPSLFPIGKDWTLCWPGLLHHLAHLIQVVLLSFPASYWPTQTQPPLILFAYYCVPFPSSIHFTLKMAAGRSSKCWYPTISLHSIITHKTMSWTEGLNWIVFAVCLKWPELCCAIVLVQETNSTIVDCQLNIIRCAQGSLAPLQGGTSLPVFHCIL
jgi:hypothetical protein